ncbi:TPA: DEAD/DEAH box helicase family protein [Pseudomonas aeruginosa]|uniref:type III restriction-modification system endonuclease n=1 Tax=Pseudomonas aeruginosa TaxID=287 RepID=UPI001904E0BA|nr:DEAD/DEAH box helicase family protein [Pseudomonas aeruginosa]MDI2458927.1 DEAD/DEAH box helicase family protein [Pseudomonas aeruginosa]QQM07263.1 DEAD/DEAH box helicase family protein [Pseudomonas aeruginosa]HBO4312098.1 DEAD/DEAH box helicase family protein [Pseudomonas aeruginosa]HBO4705268.1 DEAD/DEAH box helicase family protein [Pseudomonas aeruginosa]HCF4396013.1 DEAD/DEAH box helicase family protein [Pseudomonas aeruginosa]
MKLHFEPDLDYQLQAIEAVCDLFRGQEACRTEFTVTMKAPAPAESDPSDAPQQFALGIAESDLGVGNRLTLLDDELHKNLRDIQLRGGLPPSGLLTSGDFTVEMETGTGKTYVYLRSIFELNKRYGFTKFVIVVPSVAIKEGVYKSLQITEEHFKSLYAGVPYDYFLYDSNKLGEVRNFATSSTIQIMVVTVGAINKKDVNNLYKDSEKTGGEKPIDLIKATRPILIVDEPQSVDGGLKGAGKTALDAMNPLCTLRYSATHIDKHHMVYRLDAVDAYERRLVKQIEVASATIEDAHNKPFVRLVAVSNKRGTISAKVELDVGTATGGVSTQEVTLYDGDDLEQATKRAVYKDLRIGEINTAKGEEFVELRSPGGEKYLRIGEIHGGVEPLAIQREMIRRTIKEHLDKEKRFRPMGIKVLSLFFIDTVERYRQYDADGNPVKGVYATIFEEEYKRFAKHPDYQSLFSEVDFNHSAEEVHNGYFSIDKKGGWSDTAENNAGNRENAERAYNLIMKDKEKLLSFSTPLKFIFSHSALKEGWDNPNVFQICTLRDIQSERERRQTIGRGLRLCVNQNGDRVRGFEVNTLTVIATESYEAFAENLQKEIEEDTGIRFGIVEEHQFAAVAITSADGESKPLGFEQSKVLWDFLKAQQYVDAKGKVQDSLKQALKDGLLQLPPEFDAQRSQIVELLKKVSGRLEIKNADERRAVPTRQAVLQSEEFKALWDRIKHQTTYRVDFNNEQLITDCIDNLQKAPAVFRPRLQWRKADLAIGKSGVEANEKKGAYTVTLDESDIELPDILTDLQDRTQLTRRTLVRILTESKRLDDFKRNPQQFIELAGEIINRCKRLALVDGIKYVKLGDDSFYAQELFEQQELTGYLKNMLLNTEKSVYEHVVYDSAIERDFTQALEHNDAVKVYAKLPGWFRIPTPLGSYNPDWAILVEQDGAERLYFVVETKSSLFNDDLRPVEEAKIKCGTAHFEVLAADGASVRFGRASNVDQVIAGGLD